MRILVNCPGGWKCGLDSPERGEGRWAQNYAEMLARAGHEVHATSGGSPSMEEHKGVHLHSEVEAGRIGRFDLYFDSAAWEGKHPVAEATFYVSVHWSLEARIRKELPHNQIIAFPYPSWNHAFIYGMNRNMERTFALPTMFGDCFEEPKFHNEKILLTTRDAMELEHVVRSYTHVLKAIEGLPINSVMSGSILEHPGIQAWRNDSRCTFVDIVPYDEIKRLVRECKLCIPVMGPSNLMDAAFAGVPSVMWERGGFFVEVARRNGLLIEMEDSESPERIGYVIKTLLTDQEVYNNYLADIQSLLSCHLYGEAIKYFNKMVEKLGL